MKSAYTFVFFALIIFLGVYVYTAAEAVCKTPLSYRIGYLDNRFHISYDEARVAVSDAESVWEQATGKNLFNFDPEGELAVNFVFDERQEFAEAEIDFRERLNSAEGVNESIRGTYTKLVDQYNSLETQYRDRVAVYEGKLAAYNAKVEEYNSEGGAPADVYAELEAEKDGLDSELGTLHRLGTELNDLVDEINALSERGNELVESYNENVSNYNERFSESREFTQGDYQSDTINIYKFTDETELRLVLIHELGHALSLGHVPGETSVMYDHLGGQPADPQLTEHDLDEFERVCGRTTRSFIERLFILFNV